MIELLVRFVDLLFTAMTFAIFGRVIISWIAPRGGDPLSNFLIQITEPILAPIRQIMPKLGMFDLSPMVALIVLNVIRPVIVRILLNAA